jgi:nucleoside-diphosphate-sugar epimerase
LKVLVTGSSGFIGRWILKLFLKKNINVIGIDLIENPDVKLNKYCHVINILDYKVLSNFIQWHKPRNIIHLAARCDLSGICIEDYDANISGVDNLCKIISENDFINKVIFTSSQLVCRVGYIPSDFNTYCPDTLYGMSKVHTEKIVKTTNGGGSTWCITRPTTVWGPLMNLHYQSFLMHIKRGTFFHTGSCPLFKSYSYVENIAYQYYKLLIAPNELIHTQTFYLADYEPISLRKYTNDLAEAMNVRKPFTLPHLLSKVLAIIGDIFILFGFQFPFNSFRLKNIVTEYVFDVSSTKTVCGELPVSYTEGVRKTVHWFKKL